MYLDVWSFEPISESNYYELLRQVRSLQYLSRFINCDNVLDKGSRIGGGAHPSRQVAVWL